MTHTQRPISDPKVIPVRPQAHSRLPPLSFPTFLIGNPVSGIHYVTHIGGPYLNPHPK